jgi:hypothetical protein
MSNVVGSILLWLYLLYVVWQKKKKKEEKESLYLLFWEGKKINYFILVNKK